MVYLEALPKLKAFLKMLKEVGVGKGATWAGTKVLLEHDARYRDIDTDIQRENLFREYIASL